MEEAKSIDTFFNDPLLVQIQSEKPLLFVTTSMKFPIFRLDPQTDFAVPVTHRNHIPAHITPLEKELLQMEGTKSWFSKKNDF